MTTFEELGLSHKTLQALEDLGFKTPSSIQEEAIPQLLSGDKDLIGLAQTGTGKTAAFGLPLVELIDTNQAFTQALILAPTRELGQQIAEQLTKYAKYQDRINVLAVYGGAPIVTQIKALKKPQHIIIATPGRLIDLIKRKSVKLEQLKYLVLDEADEMLQMGFKDELDEILSYTPSHKNVWLFSATMPTAIKKIVSRYMDDPAEVRINAKEKVNASIKHHFVVVKQAYRTEALLRFMDVNPEMKGVVFCRTKRDTQNLAEELLKKNYKADALHGDLTQAQRDRVMKRFKAHALQVLIATDVAARGIDVEDLTHVFHYALPDNDEYYTHRSGRTGRAGKKGVSISFVGVREQYRLERLGKALNIKFNKISIPTTSDIAGHRIKKWGQKISRFKSDKLVDDKLLERANNLLGELSKEEIIKRLVQMELNKMSAGSTVDLNDLSEQERGRGRHRRKGSRGPQEFKNKYRGKSGHNFKKKKSGKRDKKRRFK